MKSSVGTAAVAASGVDVAVVESGGVDESPAADVDWSCASATYGEYMLWPAKT